jgi:hypothetical protein
MIVYGCNTASVSIKIGKKDERMDKGRKELLLVLGHS